MGTRTKPSSVTPSRADTRSHHDELDDETLHGIVGGLVTAGMFAAPPMPPPPGGPFPMPYPNHRGKRVKTAKG